MCFLYNFVMCSAGTDLLLKVVEAFVSADPSERALLRERAVAHHRSFSLCGPTGQEDPVELAVQFMEKGIPCHPHAFSYGFISLERLIKVVFEPYKRLVAMDASHPETADLREKLLRVWQIALTHIFSGISYFVGGEKRYVRMEAEKRSIAVQAMLDTGLPEVNQQPFLSLTWAFKFILSS